METGILKKAAKEEIKEEAEMKTFDFTTLLKSEIKPALGVTEVGAIALAAARAYDAVGGSLLHIEMTMNGGMYKNAFSCAIPGTKELGCEMAAALGALGGRLEAGAGGIEKYYSRLCGAGEGAFYSY